MTTNPTEILRVGMSADEGMPVAKLTALLDAVNASDKATIRHRNGQLIIEEPAAGDAQ